MRRSTARACWTTQWRRSCSPKLSTTCLVTQRCRPKLQIQLVRALERGVCCMDRLVITTIVTGELLYYMYFGASYAIIMDDTVACMLQLYVLEDKLLVGQRIVNFTTVIATRTSTKHARWCQNDCNVYAYRRLRPGGGRTQARRRRSQPRAVGSFRGFRRRLV